MSPISQRLVWLIWSSDSAGEVWLEAAWDDDSVSGNPDGWNNELAKAERYARTNGGVMRTQRAWIPGAHELFEVPTVQAEIAT